MLCLSQLPLSVAFAIAVALGASAAPSVNVGMNAAFPRAPYLLELLETAASENATSYFPLLDKIASGHFTSTASDADLYSQFLDTLKQDGHITSPEALSTFNLALSLRSAAPRIEAHYQYYSTAIEPAVEGAKQSTDCQEWVLLNNQQYCTPALDSAEKRNLFPSGVKLLPFDRIVGVGDEAVLYADPTSSSFGPFHEVLAKSAREGKLSYRLRYRRSSQAPKTPLPVSGYGVELALKRTDYIVIDDREASQDPDEKPINAEVALDAEEEVADLKPLSSSDLAPLGLKTASFILKSENPFDTLVKSTQDFPRFSTSIATQNISDAFVKELEANREQMIPSGISFLWMNGVQLIERQVEPFTLVEMIRRERKLINGVRELGLSGKQAVALLGHQLITEAKSQDDSVRFDWTDRLEDGKALIWLNDLEKDERYEGLPKSLMALLQRTYPGQLPQVARNIFNVVAPIDFSNSEDVAVAIQLIGFMLRGLPLRFGFAPLTSTPDAVGQAKIAYYLIGNYGVEALAAYFQAVHKASTPSPDKKVYSQIVKDYDLLPEAVEMTFAEVLEAQPHAEQVKAAQLWARRLNADSVIRPVFADGVAIPREKSWMQTMSMKLSEDLQVVQRAVYEGVIGEDKWVPEIFLEKAMQKRNTYIFPEDDKDLRVLDINKIYSEHADFLGQIPVLDAYEESTKENWAVLSVIADLDSQDGQDLLLSSLQFKRNNPGVRLDIIHNPPTSAGSASVNGALKVNEAKLADVETIDELKSILKEETDAKDGYENALAAFLLSTKLPTGSQLLILNGRVVGPISSDALFTEDDFQQLLEFEQTHRILPVYAAIDDLDLGERLSGPIAAAKLTSITALSTIFDLPEGIFESAPAIRSTIYNTWNSTHTAIEVGDPETASVHIAGLLNPTSEQGQRWAPILKVISELDGVYLKLFLNPRDRVEELPIKRFFRYVLDSKPSFDEAGNVKGPKATFKGLPSEALLTAAMDVPPAWLVAPKSSIHDLDNIKLSSVKSDVDATYELENILIEGHSRELKGRGAPKGAQLVLATEKNPLVTDTIIMANLGYFQFKANPGFYNIQLKEGRSTDIFSIESVGAQGYSAVPGDEGTDIALMDFQGTTLYPRLTRKPGMEEANVLEQLNATEDSIVAKGFKFAESILGGSKTKSVSVEEHAEINIFSVASGHLYERMLNIMMVSVMRNTKHTVKFWFIEQFLSPSFKDFIPHMAKEYGFKYEMVTFKWPHWLRQQKEKQREIWGYKILFLDVLFPLSLDKVIFVDADQIVRTDMIDLVNLDLNGAPYGFTPMCDSRTEMEGFRFWKQGYWANYLRGLPYHISALYVVDLRRFRELAAGDRLRQQYHALSADPNSLANLDQDLPNHMQFSIPIHSLPQEWLWCETWCSDESLANARTIDLCNNPQTKEPKLDRARRQVPEWTEYDDEIAALDRRRKGVADEKAQVNTKSRRFEEEVHTKDEL